MTTTNSLEMLISYKYPIPLITFLLYLTTKYVEEIPMFDSLNERYLIPYANKLRRQSTKPEIILWSRLRHRQILNTEFHRQYIIGSYIVDFCAPSASLIIELDGSQHFEEPYLSIDKAREEYFNRIGMQVLRFDNGQVMRSLKYVLDAIFYTLEDFKKQKI